jgi:hypothetical protein
MRRNSVPLGVGPMRAGDTILMLLQIIGCVAFSFLVPLALALLDNDAAFAGKVGAWHLANGAALGYCMAAGGAAHKLLLPFVAHNFVSGAGLLLSTPGKWRALLDKVHVS